MQKEYKIDFDMFTTLEIIQILQFMQLVESTKIKKVDPNELKEKYITYRNILKNKALEKKYDRMLYEKSQVSIYQVMKEMGL